MSEIIDYGFGIEVEHYDSMHSYVIVGKLTAYPFKGETAWSDAERFANDLMLERMYK